MSDYDILWVGDLRFPGGTGTAIAEEIAASHAVGYRCGLVPMRSAILGFPHPINGRIRHLIDQGKADLIDPRQSVSSKLCCLYHPQSFSHFPLDPPRIDAGVKLLIATHPPFGGDGSVTYDAAAIDDHVQELLGGGVLWAPVGPSVRRQFLNAASPPPLLDHDWYGVIDQRAWQVQPRIALGRTPVIGRHSRPDPAKWPDTRMDVLEVYPDCADVSVRVLGDGPFLRELIDPMPANWQVFLFNQISPQAFLGRIGVFVYFHHSRWVEAFGYAILEALASRLPVVLPSHFEPLFQEAAVYAEPDGVRAIVDDLYTDQKHYRERGDLAAEIVERRFSHRVQHDRVRALIGRPSSSDVVPMRTERDPRPVQHRRVRERRRRRALMISSNGVGMGHLTRLLAIARRLPPTIDPIFLTMSRAAHVVGDFGYPVEYLPFHAAIGCDVRLWNHHLRRDLAERFAFYRPDVVIFDGNVPYDGLINAMSSIPTCPLIWSRRAMWTKGAGREFIWRERFADVVIEPGEVAGELDRGLTTEYRGKTRAVAPILLHDVDEALSKDEARAALGLDADRPACLIQLGSGNNFDIGILRHAILDGLARDEHLQIVWLDWAIAEERIELADNVKRMELYPIARYLRAFDLAVSAAGYNAYHELLAHKVPTIFVPNEHPMMDDQLARAFFAEQHGIGLMLRKRDHYGVSEVLERFLDPVRQRIMRERCARHESVNGAVEAASILEELAYTCRADLDPADDVIHAMRRFGGS